MSANLFHSVMVHLLPPHSGVRGFYTPTFFYSKSVYICSILCIHHYRHWVFIYICVDCSTINSIAIFQSQPMCLFIVKKLAQAQDTKQLSSSYYHLFITHKSYLCEVKIYLCVLILYVSAQPHFNFRSCHVIKNCGHVILLGKHQFHLWSSGEHISHIKLLFSSTSHPPSAAAFWALSLYCYCSIICKPHLYFRGCSLFTFWFVKVCASLPTW